MYSLSPKKFTHFVCYNSDMYEQIWIIFRSYVTQKVSNQKMLYFPISLKMLLRCSM